MHFTYKLPSGDLAQGDLLRNSGDLKEVLERYHPYYANKIDYEYLLVVTQSCDLALREGGKCKAPYISICPARPASHLIQREISKAQHSEEESQYSLCKKDFHSRLLGFTEKLLNNNCGDYFYLHEDPSFGLHEPLVGYLALSISIKREHYDACEGARILSLDPVFSAKLGWLVGNIYSGVATPDWTPEHVRADEFKLLIQKRLDELGLCVWVSEAALKAFKKEIRARKAMHGDQYVMPESEVTSFLKSLAVPKDSKRNKAIDACTVVVKDTLKLDDETAERIKRRLYNNLELSQLLT